VTRVLLIGGGAREHAIAWKLRQSPDLSALHVAPGNPGIAEIADCHRLHIPKPGAPEAEIAAFFEDAARIAQEVGAELVAIGPDDPLVFGLTDALESRGFPVFGPSKAAAAIEGSKSFAKDLMRGYGIPMGRAERFDDFDAALRYVDSRSGNVVVKADGMALGKGAIVTDSHEEAAAALRELMVEGALGPSGRRVVIEDRLEGRETSAMAFSDGRTVAHMPFSCDHKPVFDGNRGPNTGGMGAYSPPSWLSEQYAEVIRHDVTERAIQAMAEDGRPYRGVLFPGIMVTAEGPRVLEFNCRFGDPEAEVLLPRLETDLLRIMRAVVTGTLSDVDMRWSDQCAVTVMLASGGYPERYETGKPISGVEDLDRDVLAFHAGTRRDEAGRLVTNGGRVLAVTALASSVEAARERVYHNVARIHFEGMHYRTDIGAAEERVHA